MSEQLSGLPASPEHAAQLLKQGNVIGLVSARREPQGMHMYDAMQRHLQLQALLAFPNDAGCMALRRAAGGCASALALTTVPSSKLIYGHDVYSPYASVFMMLPEHLARQFPCVRQATVRSVANAGDDKWLHEVLVQVEATSGVALLASRRWFEAGTSGRLTAAYEVFVQNQHITHLVIADDKGGHILFSD